ncbi:MAG: hypothetical protein ACD_39C00404G0004, partial [uncultured bacterium]
MLRTVNMRRKLNAIIGNLVK